MKKMKNNESLMYQKWTAFVKQRDNHTCKVCNATGVKLYVTPIVYAEGKKIWDYHSTMLTTLCENCTNEAVIFAPLHYKTLGELISEATQQPIFSILKEIEKRKPQFMKSGRSNSDASLLALKDILSEY